MWWFRQLKGVEESCVKSVYSILKCGFGTSGKPKLTGSFPIPQKLSLSSGFVQNLNLSVDIRWTLFSEWNCVILLSSHFAPTPQAHWYSSWNVCWSLPLHVCSEGMSLPCFTFWHPGPTSEELQESSFARWCTTKCEKSKNAVPELRGVFPL